MKQCPRKEWQFCFNPECISATSCVGFVSDDTNKVSESLKEHACRFAEWLFHLDNGTTHYNPFTKEKTESIGFSPYDCVIDKTKTISQLYDIFMEENK